QGGRVLGRRPHRRRRRLPRQGVRGAHEATRVRRAGRRPRDAAQAPGARLDRGVRDSFPRLQGHADGRADGQRARDRPEPRGLPGRPGAEPAPSEGRRSRSDGRTPHGALGREGARGSGGLMATAPVLDRSGKKVGDQELPAGLFEAPVNVSLMHQVVVAGLASLRAGTHSTKTRGEVSGGGKKPWRQKGTGRARHGSTRSPIWSGGGVAHGPKPRDHSVRVNKKMKRGALRSALSDAVSSGKLAVIDELGFDEPRTRDAAGILEALELQGKVLVVLPEPETTVEKSFRNLRQVRLTYARSLSVY